MKVLDHKRMDRYCCASGLLTGHKTSGSIGWGTITRPKKKKKIVKGAKERKKKTG